MTPDEVRMLDNSDALLFIRGERPVMDKKYDILKHPNILLTTDGGAEPYIHGSDTRSACAVTLDDSLKAQAQTLSLPEGIDFELLSEEEILAQFEQEEKPNESKQKPKARHARHGA